MGRHRTIAPQPSPTRKAEPSAQPLNMPTFTDLGEMERRRESYRQGGRGVWRLPIRACSWSPVWSLPPLSVKKQTLSQPGKQALNPKDTTQGCI